MGAWGVKLNQNDVYSDIKDYYTALLKYGISDEAALEHTLNEFSGYIGDMEDGDLFWLSLADIMWRLGRLNDEVRSKALKHIDSPSELAKWYEVSERSGDARKKILEELKLRLTSEQPAMKRFGKKRYKKCTWSDGDIYRYELAGETAIKYDMTGKYLVLQKIGDYFQEDLELSLIKSVIGNNDSVRGDIFPIIRFWITDDAAFVPTSENRNECIPTMGVKGVHAPKDHRFYILDYPDKCDRFGFVCNSELIIPDNEDAEFIEKNRIEPRHLTWKFFEYHVIGRYLWWTKGIDIFSDK